MDSKHSDANSVHEGEISRRAFVYGAAVGAAALAIGERPAFATSHGDGAHAPDEYWIIESSNPKVAGMDGAVRSYVDLLYALG